MPKRTKDPAYLAKVAQLPCVVCGVYGVHVHHKTNAGFGMRASDYDTMPICSRHHQFGNYGEAIHSGVKEWERLHGSQEQHIATTREKLGYDKDL